MRTRQNRTTKFGIIKSGIAIFFGCLVFLSGIPLHGQDQLQKEYIYLDGRLLVVERQPTPAFAQKPPKVEDKGLNAGMPVDGSFLSAFLPEMAFPHSPESSVESAASEQCQGNAGRCNKVAGK